MLLLRRPNFPGALAPALPGRRISDVVSAPDRITVVSIADTAFDTLTKWSWLAVVRKEQGFGGAQPIVAKTLDAGTGWQFLGFGTVGNVQVTVTTSMNDLNYPTSDTPLAPSGTWVVLATSWDIAAGAPRANIWWAKWGQVLREASYGVKTEPNGTQDSDASGPILIGNRGDTTFTDGFRGAIAYAIGFPGVRLTMPEFAAIYEAVRRGGTGLGVVGPKALGPWFPGAAPGAGPILDVGGRGYHGVVTNGTRLIDGPRILFAAPARWQEIVAAILLDAAVTGTASASGQLTTEITLAAGVTGVATVAAALTTEIQMAASVTGSVTVNAALATEIRMAAAATGSATAAAALTTEIQMSAAATGTAAAAGALTTEIRLAAGVTGTAAATADLTVEVGLEAAITAAASIVAVLMTEIRMTTAVTGSASAVGALTTEIRLQALVTGTATVAAPLTTAITLMTAVQGTATAAAGLTTEITLAGAVQAAAAIAAALTTEIRFAATVLCTAGAIGELIVVLFDVVPRNIYLVPAQSITQSAAPRGVVFLVPARDTED